MTLFPRPVGHAGWSRKDLTPFEKAIQDADMPRCPVCRRPLGFGENMAVVTAHAMLALVHEECRAAVERQASPPK